MTMTMIMHICATLFYPNPILFPPIHHSLYLHRYTDIRNEWQTVFLQYVYSIFVTHYSLFIPLDYFIRALLYIYLTPVKTYCASVRPKELSYQLLSNAQNKERINESHRTLSLDYCMS